MDRLKLLEKNSNHCIKVHYMMNRDGSWTRCSKSWIDLEKSIYHDEEIIEPTEQMMRIVNIQELDIYDCNMIIQENLYLLELKDNLGPTIKIIVKECLSKEEN